VDRGGVAPEPWHLSYRPLARDFQRLLSPELVARMLNPIDIALKTVVIASLEEIFARFVRVPD
ncbi:MAG: M15 family metallopeptidase, partial [Porticoccaceae bacterium]